MTEKGPETNTKNLIEPSRGLETKHTIKDSWFNAYIEANAMAPQTHSGIDIYLADAVLQDPPTDFKTFIESEFSPAQFKRISEIMSRIHTGLGIPHVTQDQTHHYKGSDEPIIVSPDRINKLWAGARNNLIVNIYSSLIPFDKNRKNAPNPKELDLFFNDPKNQEKIRTLKEIVKVMKVALKDKKVQASLKIFRESLVRNPRKPESLLIAYELLEAIKREIVNIGLTPDDPLFKQIISAFKTSFNG